MSYNNEAKTKAITLFVKYPTSSPGSLRRKKSSKSFVPQMWDIENITSLFDTYRHGKEEQWCEDANGTNQWLLLLFQLPKSFCAKQLISQSSRIISITDNRVAMWTIHQYRNLKIQTKSLSNQVNKSQQPMRNLYYLTSNHCEIYIIRHHASHVATFGVYHCVTFLLGP